MEKAANPKLLAEALARQTHANIVELLSDVDVFTCGENSIKLEEIGKVQLASELKNLSYSAVLERIKPFIFYLRTVEY